MTDPAFYAAVREAADLPAPPWVTPAGIGHAVYDLLLERAQEALAFERERADRAEADAARLRALLSEQDEHFLTPAQVAAMFTVEPRTVSKWADAGKLPSVRTAGGHRRFREADVRRLLADRRGRLTGEARGA